MESRVQMNGSVLERRCNILQEMTKKGANGDMEKALVEKEAEEVSCQIKYGTPSKI